MSFEVSNNREGLAHLVCALIVGALLATTTTAAPQEADYQVGEPAGRVFNLRNSKELSAFAVDPAPPPRRKRTKVFDTETQRHGDTAR